MTAQANSVANDIWIVRDRECMRSREYRGVSIRVIHECSALQVLRTEMEAGSRFDNSDLGESPAFHFVIDGNPVFHGASESANLMPGDSIIYNEKKSYAITNAAPLRSVILSVLFKNTERVATGAVSEPGCEVERQQKKIFD